MKFLEVLCFKYWPWPPLYMSLVFFIGIWCRSIQAETESVTIASREENEYLLVRNVDASGNPTYFLLDPADTDSVLCALNQSDRSTHVNSSPPECPEAIKDHALSLSNNLLDPSNRHHSKFSLLDLNHVQIMNNGYLYRHMDHRHCIYWVPSATWEEVPFYCTGISEEIMQFIAYPVIDELLVTFNLFTGDTLLRLLEPLDNTELKLTVHIKITRGLICVKNEEGTYGRYTRIWPLSQEDSVPINDYSAEALLVSTSSSTCISRDPSSRNQYAFMGTKGYIVSGSTSQIMEYDVLEGSSRVLWSGTEFPYSQHYPNSFAILKKQKLNPSPLHKHDACSSCTGCCFHTKVKQGIQCLCPYMVLQTSDLLCSSEIFLPRFVVYDEAWTLPLFGRDELEPSVNLTTQSLPRQVFTMASRNRDTSLCWTYKDDGTVRCRNLLDKRKDVFVIGKIQEKSTMLVFSLDGDDMFYNDGNCGQIYMYSFRLRQEYKFPPSKDLTCNSQTSVLDTENKIFFWVVHNIVKAHALVDGTAGNPIVLTAEESMVPPEYSLAVDMAKKELITYSSHALLCKISYTRILNRSISWTDLNENECIELDSNYPFVSQLQLWGGYLFGISAVVPQSADLDEDRKALWFVKLPPQPKVEVADLLYLHAAQENGQFNWTFIVNGQRFKRKSSAPLSDSYSNATADTQYIDTEDSEETIVRTPAFRRLAFLSPLKAAGSSSDLCKVAPCTHFCFAQFQSSSPFVCACPEDMVLIDDFNCTEKTNVDDIPIPITNPSEPDAGNTNWVIYIAISVSVLLAVIVCGLGIFLYRASSENKTLKRILRDIHKGDPEAEKAAQSTVDKVLHQPLSCDILINDLRIDTKSVLGEGNFGLVLKGTYKDVDVAVKTLKLPVNYTYLSDLVKEAKTMSYIGEHPHIVRMYGADVNQVKQGKMYIALEYSPYGSLLDKLRKLNRSTGREERGMSISCNYQNSYLETSFVSNQLRFLDWAEQIASGMHYLSTKNIFHGDLATRNILVFHNDVLKISDFGLSRRLCNYSNYTKGNQTPLPWRWMAYESLTRLLFSTKSDVWAYGVTLWEIYSLGDVPFARKEWNDDFVQGLARNELLSKPAHASESIYERLMRPCWILDPEERPDFSQVLTLLEEVKSDARSDHHV